MNRFDQILRLVAIVAAVCAVIYAAVSLFQSFDVTTGKIVDKVAEPERRWWTPETECARYGLVPYVTMCGDSTCTRMRSQCVVWNRYQQEWIDGPDWVINVLGEDSWGNLKMKRIYLPQSTWDGVHQGMRWDERELPDMGDSHRKGQRT